MIARTTTRQLDLDALLIILGTESIHTVIDQALTLSVWFVRLRGKDALLKNVAEGQGTLAAVLSAGASLFYSSTIEFPETFLQRLCAV